MLNLKITDIKINQDFEKEVLEEYAHNGYIECIQIRENQVIIKEELDNVLKENPFFKIQYDNILDLVENEICCFIFDLK